MKHPKGENKTLVATYSENNFDTSKNNLGNFLVHRGSDGQTNNIENIPNQLRKAIEVILRPNPC